MSTTIDSASHSAPVRRPLWRRLIGFNLLSAVVLGVGGYYLGWFIGHQISTGKSFEFISATDENDVALLLAYVLRRARLPRSGSASPTTRSARLLGRPASLREKEDEGIGRYFGLCTDHKVVGIQYLFGIGLFFFVGGLNAMLIRTELLQPTADGRRAESVPVARRHARDDDDGDDDLGRPRPVRQLLRAADDRRPPDGLPADRGADLLAADGRRLHPHLDDLLRRLPDRLDRLRAAQRPGRDGDGLLHHVLRAGRHLDVPARAEHDRDDHHDARARADLVAAADLRLVGARDVGADGARGADADRDAADGGARPHDQHDRSSSPGGGGSPYLFENLFWFFGHPEVYILALPGFGIVLELLPVFTRKPLWGYRLAVAGMLGVSLLSFFVWQHHLFVSGINADLRPFYMLSTEIISIPTGFIFLCVMGTLWKARSIVHRADAVLPRLGRSTS